MTALTFSTFNLGLIFLEADFLAFIILIKGLLISSAGGYSNFFGDYYYYYIIVNIRS